MTFDDRLRRELQDAIPEQPPVDPDALMAELLERSAAPAGGEGSGAGGGGGGVGMMRMVLGSLAVGLVVGGGWWLLFGDSAPPPTSVFAEPQPSLTTAPLPTTTTLAPSTTQAPVTTEAPAATQAPATTEATATTETTPTTEPPDTTPPAIGSLSASPTPIWELDDVVSCGTNPRSSTVSASVTDAGGVASVTMAWTFASGQSGSASLSGSGIYSGSFGPFPYLTVPDNQFEQVTITVTAVDGAGNSSAALVDVTVVSTSTCFG